MLRVVVARKQNINPRAPANFGLKQKNMAPSSKGPKGPAPLDLFGWAETTTTSPSVEPVKSKRAAPKAKIDPLPTVLSSRAVETPPPPQIEEPTGPTIYSVAEVSSRIKDTLADTFPEILVQGEIADFKGIHRSGHLYFGLKDDKAQIRAVMWRHAVQKLPFEIKPGLEVIVTGKIDYYAGSGSLQIVVERMEPVGIGALQLKFEQLKEKLKAEGLFDTQRKRKIGPLNWRIGLVTGRSTAALQDMLKIFRTRFPLAQIYLFHASVQGEKAPGEIIEAIRLANRYSAQAEKPLDLLIVGRGGGSYEDLFCFNDEALARALAASTIPTVSAVGHEIDFTIADMVADRRAATPTHAAQEAVPEAALWIERLAEMELSFGRQMIDMIRDLQQRVDTFYNRFTAAAPQKKLLAQKDLLHQYRQRLEYLMKMQLERRKARLGQLASVLDALSPLKVLDRGYSLVRNAQGGVVKSIKEATVGTELTLRLPDGEVRAQVTASQALCYTEGA